MSKNTIKYEGKLDLNGFIIPCYVLEDGTRLISGRGMQESLKMEDTVDAKSTSGARLNRYLDQKTLNPFIYKGKDPGHFEPIVAYKGKQKINGYEATILADICEGFLEARKHINLSSRQQIIADQCEILIRAFARVGIIALVDEATGYQYEREKDALQEQLKLWVSPEILDWQKAFHNDFYREIYRLKKWTYTAETINKRTQYLGKITLKYIYGNMPKGTVDLIKQQTPKSKAGNYTVRLHQSLTPDVGREYLRNQLITVTTMLRLARSWQEFENFYMRQYGQTEIDFDSIAIEDKSIATPSTQKIASGDSDFDIKMNKALKKGKPK